jgi:hypothetical protein
VRAELLLLLLLLLSVSADSLMPAVANALFPAKADAENAPRLMTANHTAIDARRRSILHGGRCMHHNRTRTTVATLEARLL